LRPSCGPSSPQTVAHATATKSHNLVHGALVCGSLCCCAVQTRGLVNAWIDSNHIRFTPGWCCVTGSRAQAPNSSSAATVRRSCSCAQPTPRHTRTHARSHARTHAHTHTHTHARTHTHTHTHTLARARTHTHTCARARTHTHTHILLTHLLTR
jgi:hypothetical protein